MSEQMIAKAERAIHERRMLGPWNDRDLAVAAHSVIAGKVAELIEQRDALRSEVEHERASRMHWQVRAALAPYPERR